jgi:hypothetical protein
MAGHRESASVANGSKLGLLFLTTAFPLSPLIRVLVEEYALLYVWRFRPRLGVDVTDCLLFPFGVQ